MAGIWQIIAWDVHNRTDRAAKKAETRVLGIPRFPGRNTMLLTFGVLLILTACAVFARMRIPGRLDAANLGWMSQQWLAEYRASHPV